VAGGVTGSVGEGDSSTLRGVVGGADGTSEWGTLRASASGTGGRGAGGVSNTFRGTTLGNGGGAMVGCARAALGAVTLVSTSVSWRRASTWLVSRGARGEPEDGCLRALTMSWMPARIKSLEEAIFGGEPTESITNECSASGPNPHSITAIRVESGTSVPAIDTMGRPKVLLRWLFVNEDANAGWSQRCPIEIEITVEGSPRRQLGMETRGAQEI
jgi:hypothetical protein